MGLDPVGILMVAAVFFLGVMWAPKKIPEIARALGEARREFDKALHGDNQKSQT